ncbi:hypothetical protein CXF92_05950 [Pseudomonas sp. Choline-3u-10]|nr:hypothetical protein CXF92_05950 [Pseudomonas sp. Choline-3u-10]
MLAKRYTQGALRIREQARFYGCDFAGECIFSAFLGSRRFTGLHDENRIAVQGEVRQFPGRDSQRSRGNSRDLHALY